MTAIRLSVVAALFLGGTNTIHASALSKEQQAAMTEALMQELGMCWTLPAGNKLRSVRVKFFLLKSGALDGEPEVVAPNPDTQEEEASAIRAVKRCSPFESVTQYPQDYENWREIIVNFDPDDKDF